MANFFKPSTKTQSTGKLISVEITRLDPNGCGVAIHQKKPIFIENTLVGEKVNAKIVKLKSKYSKANVSEILTSSPHRVEPKCSHFKQCGGCNIQHLNYSQHLPFKQQKVTDLFARNNMKGLLPWAESITGKQWHYRRKARIGVQYNKLGEPIVGFRQKKSNTLINIKSCPVLTESISDIFFELKNILKQLTLSQSVGHIEVIDTQCITIVIRQLIPLTDHDAQLWLNIAEKLQWQVYIDDGKSVVPLTPIAPLYYQLQLAKHHSSKTSETQSNHHSLRYDVTIQFEPKDFIQINHEINEKMIVQALQWLALKQSDIVLDLFCGLGNFSLPIAQNVEKVIGVEGMQSMVDKAIYNANTNGINNALFYQADLNNDWGSEPWVKLKYSKLLLDPARAGAYEALLQSIKLSIPTILYVSCDPVTLAKDSQLLQQNGYKIEKITIMDMFVHTKHIETMVLFIKL